MGRMNMVPLQLSETIKTEQKISQFSKTVLGRKQQPISPTNNVSEMINLIIMGDSQKA
jgi:hypothetical protein